MSTKAYEVVIDGYTTTLALSDEDARARGLLAPEVKAVRPAANKARPVVANKAAAAKGKTDVGAPGAGNGS